ncbi:hypothetical protein [Acaryochloris sp. IP29b_bin.137]|uniref:hypothetical protein n=1 Tax=Acaryochloris sp. IP29b_bin.137 TaxID=2969217 RepID=UPI002612B5BD|nr:hypothetical protein [Acaryochloris sp. IP29b_bin.137]
MMRVTFFVKFGAILTVLLALFSCSNSNSNNSNQPRSDTSSPSSEVPTKKVAPFTAGVSKATSAAKLAQAATSLAEWRQVNKEWQSAIDFMQAVPTSSPNYKIAKQNVEEYQKSLADARQTVNRLKKDQEAQVVRGEEVFTSLKGIYQTAGEATATPVVRIVIPQAGWEKLSKSDQISLTMYAESLVSVVKSNPSEYVSIPPSAPIYKTFVRKVANLCQDCWSIIISYKDSQPYGIDKTVVQGNTPGKSAEPCCRGIKSSEFRN